MFKFLGNLIHATSYLQVEYVLDLTLRDSLLVSTSRSDIKTDLIEVDIFQQVNNLVFFQLRKDPLRAEVLSQANTPSIL